MLIDGGIRIPSVPPAAIVPRNNRSLYPRFSISPIATVPIVAAVATDDPDVAANIAQAAMFECIKPPGSQGIHFTSAAYIRSAIPDRSRISPSNTKNGIATNRNAFAVAQETSPIAKVNGNGE